MNNFIYFLKSVFIKDSLFCLFHNYFLVRCISFSDKYYLFGMFLSNIRVKMKHQTYSSFISIICMLNTVTSKVHISMTFWLNWSNFCHEVCVPTEMPSAIHISAGIVNSYLASLAEPDKSTLHHYNALVCFT